MAEHNEENEPLREKKLRKENDFREELQNRDENELRQELELPDVDQILKDLQNKYGIRVGLSRNLIERFEDIKERAKLIGYFPDLKYGCMQTDVCVVCDQNDRCSTCDAMDWCITVDTH